MQHRERLEKKNRIFSFRLRETARKPFQDDN